MASSGRGKGLSEAGGKFEEDDEGMGVWSDFSFEYKSARYI